MYFLLHSGEDGISITPFKDETELLQRIIPDEDGDTYYGGNLVFLDRISCNDGYFYDCPENSILIIKGEIVVPKAVQTVIRYELP